MNRSQLTNLLFIDHTPFAGGAQLVLAEHIHQLDKTKYQVHVACTNSVPQLIDRYQQAGATVHLIGMDRLKGFSPLVPLRLLTSVNQVRQIIRQHHIDITISNTSRASYVATLATWGTKSKLIWWIRDFLYNKRLFSLLRSRTAKIICVSMAIKKAYMDEQDPHGQVIYVASNIYQQYPQVKAQDVRQERARWGFGPDDIVVGFMGRLVTEKGPQLLVEAVSRISKTNPRVKALIVGTGKNQMNDNEQQLHQMVEESGKQKQIVFAGYQSQEALYYSLFDIFTMITIDVEAFATTVVQAMMAKKPVIATNVGGTPELVVNRQTGLLIEPLSVDQLVAAIEFYVKNPDKADQIAQTGYQVCMDNHREEVATTQLQDVYQQILGLPA